MLWWWLLKSTLLMPWCTPLWILCCHTGYLGCVSLRPALQPLCSLQCAFKSRKLSALLISPTWGNLRENLWARRVGLLPPLPTTMLYTACVLGCTSQLRIIWIQEHVRSRHVLRVRLQLGLKARSSLFVFWEQQTSRAKQAMLPDADGRGFQSPSQWFSVHSGTGALRYGGTAELLVLCFKCRLGVWNLLWSALCEQVQKCWG